MHPLQYKLFSLLSLFAAAEIFPCDSSNEMSNTKDAIPIKKENKAAMKVLKQCKTYQVNEKFPQKMPNSLILLQWAEMET